MSVTLWEVYHLATLIGRSAYSKRVVVEDFWDVHFSCIMIEGRVIYCNMNDFSGNLFAIMV